MSEETKKEILNKELSDEELKAVSGGAQGQGGCQGPYYEGNCVATVESTSWCWSNDYCLTFDCRYKETDAVVDFSGHD